MLTQTLWWTTDALMACLLFRGLRGRFFSKYLIFYIYLSHVLGLELVRFLVYNFKPKAYGNFYWHTEFLSVAIGYCVIWEIYGRALAAYPGPLRMARLLVTATFVLIVAKVFSTALSDTSWALAQGVGELERNLRTVQAVLLVVVLAVVNYYMIPIGRNLRGIILGYGFYIGALVVINTVWSRFGDTLHLWLQYFQPTAWLVTLLFWSATLWSYHPNPEPEGENEIERDYELIAARTALNMAKARGYLVRAIRQ